MSIRLELRNGRTPFWKSEHGIDWLIAVFGCLSVVVLPLKSFLESRFGLFEWLVVVIAAFVLLGQYRKYVLREKKASTQSDSDALDAVLECLHRILQGIAARSHESADLRMCVFVPDPKNNEFVYQLTDYVGPNPRYGRDREISVRAGVVGRAIREGAAEFASPSERVQTSDYLVQLGFTREEATGMSLDRRSWAAVPIGNGPGRILAVLYADAKTEKFFGKSADTKRKVLQAAAIALAGHLRPAYTQA